MRSLFPTSPRPGGLRFALIYLLVTDYVVAWWLGGWWSLLVPTLVFALIPTLDAVLGLDTGDPDGGGVVGATLLRAWAPIQIAVQVGTIAAMPHWNVGPALLLGVALGVVSGGGGITIAHELIHRRSRIDRAMGEILMTSVSYPWFCVEHVLGHHRWVATPKDPATARFGEPVYRFVPRSIVGQFLSFLAIERDYAGRRGIRWWSLRDRRTRYALTTVATWSAVALLGGALGVLVFAIQSAVAVLLLEVINYVEHYGLSRAELRPGEYERVAPEHSWNSNHWLTAAFLFNLPRHADHHAYASRPFQDLRPWPDAPEMPVGYPTMVLVALVPPLWFRVMDARTRGVWERTGQAVQLP